MSNESGAETAESLAFACPSCGTGYRVPAARADTVAQMRCGVCAHVWTHRQDEAEASAERAPEPEPEIDDLPEGIEAEGDGEAEPVLAAEDEPIETEAIEDGPIEGQIAATEEPSEASFEDDETEVVEAKAAPDPASVDDVVWEGEDDATVSEAAETPETVDITPETADIAEAKGAETPETDDTLSEMDAPIAQETARDRRRARGVVGRRMAQATAACILCLGLAGAAAGLAARDTLVAHEPRLAALFEAVGAPVNLTPFSLMASEARLAAHGDTAHLTFTVTLGNRAERPHVIPALDVTLLDRVGAMLDRRSLRVPSGSVNGLGETSFKARIDLPPTLDPEAVGDVVIGLAPTPDHSAGPAAAFARLQPIGPMR
ncbi:MAG: DUF3426 domain-containing protein [Pseudomonadota bacterium]